MEPEPGSEQRHKCNRTGSHLDFFSVNVIFVLGFRFCFELPSTFFVQATGFILLLAVSGCEYETLLFVCSVKQVGSGRRGGQGHFKHAWERRRRCGWTRIRRGVRRRKKQVCSFFFILHLW
jgi:hypothetical protein